MFVKMIVEEIHVNQTINDHNGQGKLENFLSFSDFDLVRKDFRK